MNDTRIHDTAPTFLGPAGEPWPPVRCPAHPRGGLDYRAGDHAQYVCTQCGRRYPVLGGIARLLASSDDAAAPLRKEMAVWDREADGYDRRRLPDGRYMAGIGAAVRALGAAPGERVLDAGCGTGLTSRRLVRSGCRVVALDVSEQSLGRLRRVLGDWDPDYVQGDLAALPFADNSFDRVLCANALQQVPGAGARAACVAELLRVLRPGGTLALTVQQYSVPRRRWGWVKEGPTGRGVPYVFRFTRAELDELLGPHLLQLRVHGAGFPLPHRFKQGWWARGVERAWQRLSVAVGWADLLVATGRKPGAVVTPRPEGGTPW
jgi:SAM-dependent methyltransferase